MPHDRPPRTQFPRRLRVFRSPQWVAKAREGAEKRWKEIGLERVTLHDIATGTSSPLICAGVNPKAVSVYRGHESIRTTFDLYGHMFPGNEPEAADLLAACLARFAGSAAAPTAAHEPHAA